MKLVDCEITVHSTNLDVISWEEKTKELIVTFKNKTQYKYKEFTENDLLKFINAESIGSYFHKHIRSNYECEKV